MAETIKKTWLTDEDGNKVAPLTLTSAIQDEDGKAFQEYVDSMIVVANEDSTEVPEVVNNSSADVVSFTSGDGEGTQWTDVSTMVSDETQSSLFGKISTMFKNVRYLFKMLGNTDISAIGDGTTTGAISTLNSNLEQTNNNLEFHKGDIFNYIYPLVGTSLSSANGKGFGIILYLPKSIGSDVTSVSVSTGINWLRTTSNHSVSLTNASVSVAGFSKNVIELSITCDSIASLQYYTVQLSSPLQFTFS